MEDLTDKEKETLIEGVNELLGSARYNDDPHRGAYLCALLHKLFRMWGVEL